MYKVPYGQEKMIVDPTTLHHVGPPDGWARRWPHRSSDILLCIDGDEHGPYVRLLELAEQVLPKLEEIERASDSYLRSFVRHTDDFYKGLWKVQSLRLDWTLGSRIEMGSEFELKLWIAEDDYGEWGVRFIRDTYPSPVFRPFAFSRTQR